MISHSAESTELARSSVVGFQPEEVRPDLPTRHARLKWVVIVDEALEIGRIVNAAICVAAAAAYAVPGILGEEGRTHQTSLMPVSLGQGVPS